MPIKKLINVLVQCDWCDTSVQLSLIDTPDCQLLENNIRAKIPDDWEVDNEILCPSCNPYSKDG